MRNRVAGLVAAVALALAGVTLTPIPVDASVSKCSTWGCARWVHYTGGAWWGTVEDIKTDGYCVSMWTIDSNGAKVKHMGTSCGGQVSGAAASPSEDTHGVRIFRGDGRYMTIVWP
jgi:hypothetical protein